MADVIGRLVAVADAVTADLNAQDAGAFGITATAKRTFLPVVDLSQIGTSPQLFVVPVGYEEDRQGVSASFVGHYELDLILQQRVGAGDPADAAVVVLVLAMQQMIDRYKANALMVCGRRAVMERNDANPAYYQPWLLTKNVFCGVVTLRFTLIG